MHNTTTQEPSLSQKVGQAIAKQRQHQKLTQAQVAELLGVSNDAISRMERGEISPSIHRLAQFAKIFDCSVATFLGQSPTINDQTERLKHLLLQLEEHEREDFLQLIEQLVKWKTDKH